jgi:hypothetical protein
MSESYKIDQHTGYPFGYGPVGKMRVKVVVEGGGVSLAKAINNAIDEGWSLYGNPVSLDHCVVQLLTKVVPVDQG